LYARHTASGAPNLPSPTTETLLRDDGKLGSVELMGILCSFLREAGNC